MPEVIQREPVDTDPIQCVKEQIQTAREKCIPISKFGLAETVSERTGMPLEQAQLLVDAYCEEHDAHIPGYLGREFNLFWPKVLAFVMATCGILVFRYGMFLRVGKKPSWMWFLVGTIIFGLGVLQWVRSLESFRIRAIAKQGAKEERLREKYAKPF